MMNLNSHSYRAISLFSGELVVYYFFLLDETNLEKNNTRFDNRSFIVIA